MKNENYETSIFLNCPFDDEFKPLMNAITFAVIQCGFILRCSLESGEKQRFNRIIKIINECKYGIHDLSRIEVNQMPRNNMPFELGLFIGSKEFRDKNKDYLVLDSEPHRYKHHITDLGGQDPSIHYNDEKTIIKCVRDWLDEISKEDLPGGEDLFEKFTQFNTDGKALAEKRKWSFNDLKFAEYSKIAIEWSQKKYDEIVEANPISPRLAKIAGELGIGVHSIVEFLKQNGINVDPKPTTRIEPEAYELLFHKLKLSFKEKYDWLSKKENNNYLRKLTISNKMIFNKEKDIVHKIKYLKAGVARSGIYADGKFYKPYKEDLIEIFFGPPDIIEYSILAYNHNQFVTQTNFNFLYNEYIQT